VEKLGIKVSKDNSEEVFKEFHQVQLETAKRQGFIPPNADVLMAEKEAFGDNIMIYKATIEEKDVPPEGENDAKEAPSVLPKTGVIAYGLMISDGLEGDYYEAASTDLNRKLPGAYAIIWQAMRDLKAAGYKRFNLWGIAPAGQPNHRYAGVTTFKTGFGGEVVEFVPAHDLVISKIAYLKNLVVETIRKKKRHL
jgi:lipid II:glycine glycyltransferase (peptidoglycan interpeptide bridge formation enzyme)